MINRSNNFRTLQILGIILISTALIFLNQNLHANREQTKALENIQEKLDVMEFEISKIQDNLNKSRAENIENYDRDSRPSIVIRLDDVGNFALDAQIEILEFHLANKFPISLGIIPSYLKSEGVLLDLLRNTALEGYEICAHGWEHENFTMFSKEMQTQRLNYSRNTLHEQFDVNASVFLPPYNEINSDTIEAALEMGFSILSTDLREGLDFEHEGIINFPVSVSFSLLSDDQWEPKNLETLSLEIMQSVMRNGHAVILLHPQEFMRDGELDFGRLSHYERFIKMLNESYYLSSFSEMKNSMSPEEG